MSGASGRARVIVWHKAPDGGPDALEQAYHAISEQLAGTPGMLGNELLRSVLRPDRFAVLSEWETLAAFQAWEQGPDHRGYTSPLRQYQDRDGSNGHYEIFEVTASH
jgi:heme-degrading monooxygenase HmoA